MLCIILSYFIKISMCSELIIVSFLFLTVDDKYFVIEIHTFYYS